jgi:ADP-heptose:LPS heptosyltransferase
VKIAIFRFSAIGDVLLLLPVIKNFTMQYPNDTITIFTKSNNAIFFEGYKNVKVHPCDFKSNYNGVLGLLKLFNAIRKEQFDFIVDLHNVLRTQILRNLLKPFTTVKVFDKAKTEKQNFISKKNISEIQHTVLRYANMFAQINKPVLLNKIAPFININVSDNIIATIFFEQHKQQINIGLAPFASHKNKMLQNETIINFLELCKQAGNINVFVFGAPSDEKKINQWAQKFECVVQTNALSFLQQIALQQQLQKMICADSANMHIAALQNIPFVSIWCATHPSLGFAPWQASGNITLSDDKLACRPCSVFGNKKCTNAIENACAKNICAQQVFMAAMV